MHCVYKGRNNEGTPKNTEMFAQSLHVHCFIDVQNSHVYHVHYTITCTDTRVHSHKLVVYLISLHNGSPLCTTCTCMGINCISIYVLTWNYFETGQCLYTGQGGIVYDVVELWL